MCPRQLVMNRVHLLSIAEAEASDDEDELDGRVEKILAPAKGSIDVENRRFVVKFHEQSYRAAKAVSESVLMQHCPQLLRNYLVKVRLKAEPAARVSIVVLARTTSDLLVVSFERTSGTTGSLFGLPILEATLFRASRPLLGRAGLLSQAIWCKAVDCPSHKHCTYDVDFSPLHPTV